MVPIQRNIATPLKSIIVFSVLACMLSGCIGFKTSVAGAYPEADISELVGEWRTEDSGLLLIVVRPKNEQKEYPVELGYGGTARAFLIDGRLVLQHRPDNGSFAGAYQYYRVAVFGEQIVWMPLDVNAMAYIDAMQPKAPERRVSDYRSVIDIDEDATKKMLAGILDEPCLARVQLRRVGSPDPELKSKFASPSYASREYWDLVRSAVVCGGNERLEQFSDFKKRGHVMMDKNSAKTTAEAPMSIPNRSVDPNLVAGSAILAASLLEETVPSSEAVKRVEAMREKVASKLKLRLPPLPPIVGKP